MTRELADELGGEADLTLLADAALARAGQPSGVGLLLAGSELIVADGASWWSTR